MKLIKRTIKKIIFHIILILDFFIKKKSNFIIIACRSGKNLDGNALALYNYLNSCHEVKVKKYLYNKTDNVGISFRSIKDIFYFLKTRYIFVTHGIGDILPFIPSKKKIVINLWHGIPLRGMGLAQGLIDDYEWTQANLDPKIDFFLMPSRIAAHRMNFCIKDPFAKFILCGQPRNDIIFKKNNHVNIINNDNFSFIILYAPTNSSELNHLFNISGFSIDLLSNYLINKNILLLIRGHHSRIVNNNYVCKNIINFSSQNFPNINEYFNKIDLLITDYSSIFIDFLITDKPIAFIHNDYEDYDKYYFFMHDKSDIWFPGKKIRNMDDLLILIDDLIGRNDLFIEQRKLLREILIPYENGKACERIYNVIKNGNLLEFKKKRERIFII